VGRVVRTHRSGCIGPDSTTPVDIFAFAVSEPIQTSSMVLMGNKIMQGNITGIGRIGLGL
jgi:hypothetical protein